MLVPSGMFKLNEENPREIEENAGEEDQPTSIPSTRQAANAAAWVHRDPSILLNCKTAHAEPVEPANWEGPGEWDPEQAMKAIEEADPFEPRLKSIE